MELFRLLGTIAINRRQAVDDIGAVEQRADTFATRFDRSMRRAEGSSKAFTAGVAGVVAGLTALGLGSVRLAGQLEQSEIAFTTLLGSGEEARSFLEDLADFAARTPFNFKGLQESSQLLLAFGFEAEQTIPIMRTLGDATSALGGGTDVLQGIARALGQIQTRGKVSTEELMQMAERGIPAFQILQDELGLTSEEVGNIGDQGIDAATGIDALLRGMSERFSGAMETQSRTMLGLFSTVQDEVSLTMTALGADIAEALDITGAMEKVISFIGTLRERIQNEGLISILEQHRSTILLVAGAITGAMVPALYALATAAGAAVVALAPFLIGGAVLGGLAALASHLEDAADQTDEMAAAVDKLERSQKEYETRARETVSALDTLTEATGPEGFNGAMDDLVSTLDASGQRAMRDFALSVAGPLVAQGKIQEAIDVTVAKFLELEFEAAEAERRSRSKIVHEVQQQLDSAQADLDKLLEIQQKMEEGNLSLWEQLRYGTNPQRIADRIAQAQGQVDELSVSLERAQNATIAASEASAAYYDAQQELASGNKTAQEIIDELTGAIDGASSSTRDATSTTGENTDATTSNTEATRENAEAHREAEESRRLAQSETADELFTRLAEFGTEAEKASHRLGETATTELESTQRRIDLVRQAIERAFDLEDISAEQFAFLERRLDELLEEERVLKIRIETEGEIPVAPGVAAEVAPGVPIPRPEVGAQVPAADVPIVPEAYGEFDRAEAIRREQRRMRTASQLRFGTPEQRELFTQAQRVKHGAITGPLPVPMPGVEAQIIGDRREIPRPGVEAQVPSARPIERPGVSSEVAPAIPMPTPEPSAQVGELVDVSGVAAQVKLVGEEANVTVKALRDDLAGAFEKVDDRAQTFGMTAEDVAAEKAAILERSIRDLIEGGFEPNSDIIQELTGQYEEFTASSESAADRVGDLASKTAEYVGIAGGMISSLFDIAEGGNTAASGIVNLASGLGEVVGMAAGIPGLGSAISAVGSTILSVLGDLRNGAAEVTATIEDRARALVTLSEENVRALTETMRVSRGGLAGLFGGTYEAIDEIATQIRMSIAGAFEGGILGGIRSGIEGFLAGEEGALLAGLKAGFSSAISAAVYEALINQAVLQGALGGLIAKMTEAFAAGNFRAAQATAQQIRNKLPSIAQELERVLAPLEGLTESLQPEGPETDPVDPGGSTSGRNISEITGPSRNLLITLLSPLSALDSLTHIGNRIYQLLDARLPGSGGPGPYEAAGVTIPSGGGVNFGLHSIVINAPSGNAEDISRTTVDALESALAERYSTRRRGRR